MKTCSKCQERKPLTEFNRRPSGRDGFNARCRDCIATVNANWRASKSKEFLRAIDRRHYQANRQRRIRNAQRDVAKFPEKHKARRELVKAMQRKEIIREPCMVCGEKAMGHHEDYNKPLEVLWLCGSHHKQRHKEINSGIDLVNSFLNKELKTEAT